MQSVECWCLDEGVRCTGTRRLYCQPPSDKSAFLMPKVPPSPPGSEIHCHTPGRNHIQTSLSDGMCIVTSSHTPGVAHGSSHVLLSAYR